MARGRKVIPHDGGTPEWARRIRAARQKAGLTLQQLADRITFGRHAYPVYQGTVAHWEQGIHEPSACAAVKLARALSVTVEHLFADPSDD